MLELKPELTTREKEVNDNAQLSWAQIYYEVAKVLELSSVDNAIFQFTSGFTEADWAENTLNEYAMANSLPLNSGPFFTKSNFALDSTYYNFLSRIVKPDIKEPEYIEASKQKTKWMDKLNLTDTPNSMNAYNVWLKHPTDPSIKTFSLWLLSKESGSWNRIIGEDNKQITYYSDIMDSYVTATQAALVNAKKKYDKVDMQEISTSSGTVKVRPVNIHPILKQVIDDWDLGQGKSITIDSDTSTKTTSSWSIVSNSDTSFSTFFGTFSTDNVLTTQDVTSDSDFHLKITIPGILNFNIERPNWFDESVINLYNQGPYAKSSDGPAFFGKSGMLVLIPTQIVVAYKISVTLTISNSLYSTYQQSWSKSSGFKVGPFKFTTDSSSGSVKITQNYNNTTTLELKDTSNVPVVIGVLSQLNKYY